MILIPTQAKPSQFLSITLAGQLCTIFIYQKSTGLFVDLYVNNAIVIRSCLAENWNRLVRDAYLGFVGDLIFADLQGTQDPTYDGLGTRYEMIYLEVADLT